MARLSIKSRYRVRIIAGAVLMVVAFVAILVAALWHEHRHYKSMRGQGVAHFDAGEFEAAIVHLEPYIGAHPSDAEALLAYARAHLASPRPDGSHLATARAAMERACSLRPGWKHARRLLMDLALNQGDDATAMTSAEALLVDLPRDSEALRAKAVILARKGRLEEAKVAAENLVHEMPQNVDARILLLYLTGRAEASSPSVMELVETWRAARPGDPALPLLTAVACRIAGDTSCESEALDRAIEAGASKPAIDLVLARQLDLAGRLDDGYAVLIAAAKRFPDHPPTVRDLIRRAWVRRAWGDIALVVSAHERFDRSRDPEMLALGTLAEARGGTPRLVESGVAALRTQQDRPVARAWLTMLLAALDEQSVIARDRIAASQQVLAYSPGHPWALHMLAEGWEELGESDVAAGVWRQALAQVAWWREPSERLAAWLIERGRHAAAVEIIDQSRRAGHTSDTLTVLSARAAIRLVDVKDEASVAAAGKLLAEVAGVTGVTGVTGVADSAIAGLLAVELALRTDDPDAAAVAADRLLDGSVVLTEPMFEQLVRLVGDRLPRVAERALAVWRAGGPTAKLAWATARTSRDPRAGYAAFVELRKQSQDPNTSAWWLADAELLDGLVEDDARAIAHWRSLVTRFPESVDVYRGLLESRRATSDEDLVELAVQRLRHHTGNGAITWRLAAARQYRDRPLTPAELLAAASLLHQVIVLAPECPEARVLLAEVLERMGRHESAAIHLEIARDLGPAP